MAWSTMWTGVILIWTVTFIIVTVGAIEYYGRREQRRQGGVELARIRNTPLPLQVLPPGQPQTEAVEHAEAEQDQSEQQTRPERDQQARLSEPDTNGEVGASSNDSTSDHVVTGAQPDTVHGGEPAEPDSKRAQAKRPRDERDDMVPEVLPRVVNGSVDQVPGAHAAERDARPASSEPEPGESVRKEEECRVFGAQVAHDEYVAVPTTRDEV